jgi:type I restriction enzyme S subunit
VTGRYGTLGEVHFITEDYWPHNTALYVKDLKGNDPRFLYYLLWHTNLAHLNDKSGVPGVNRNDLHEIEVMRPPLPEQQAIAQVLGRLDDKIELNRRMNKTLEDLARGLFRSWFVDFDPVTKNGNAKSPAAHHDIFPERFVDSPLGPIPEGWRPGSVADLARYVNGRNFTKNATGTGRMVVRIAELNSGPGGSTAYNDVKAEPENVVHPGDLLFAWSGSLDVYRWNRDEALVNQHIFKVVCEAYPQWFVHFHLCEAMPFFQGIAADKATTMGHIKREHLRQAELALPTDAALKYASAQIEPIYGRLLANERESLRLAATRDALLPQLLSGDIRLSEVRDLARSV